MHRLCVLLILAGSAPAFASESDTRDPWQRMNRVVFNVNDTLDRHVAIPLARGYRAATPAFVDRGITAFFRNLDDVSNGVNFVLQGEGGKAAGALGRVTMNSWLGLGGVIDVASAGGLPRHDTRFGTTLGKWGVGNGPYLVLPALGPSSLRDAPAMLFDMTVNPLQQPLTVVDEDAVRLGLEFVDLVDTRADLLDYEQAVVGDRYTFIRDAWLQSRDFDVHGAPEKDPFLDDESFDEAPAE